MMKYLQMDYEDLKKLSYEELLEAKSEIENTDPLDVNRYNIIVNTLAEKEPQAEQPVVEGNQQSTLRTYEFIQKFNFDEYAGTEGNLLNSIVQSFLNSKAKAVAEQYEERITKLQSELQGETEQRINLQYQNQQHQGNIQLLSEANLALTEEKNRYKDEYEDYKSRFDAAGVALVEKDAEIERLKQREADLQEQIARAPAPTAMKVIDISGTDMDDADALIRKAEEIKQAKYLEEQKKEAERLANRPKITNVRWEKEFGFGAKTVYLAELVGNYPGIGADGATIPIKLFDINKYQEVSAEDAARFRAEQAQQSAATAETSSEETTVPDTALVDIPEVQPVEDFRSEEVGHLEGLDTTVAGQVLPQTLEERVSSLEKKVEILFNNQNIGKTFKDPNAA